MGIRTTWPTPVPAVVSVVSTVVDWVVVVLVPAADAPVSVAVAPAGTVEFTS